MFEMLHVGPFKNYPLGIHFFSAKHAPLQDKCKASDTLLARLPLLCSA